MSNRATTKALILAMVKEQHEEIRVNFMALGNNKTATGRPYNITQRNYALSLIDDNGLKCTAGILHISTRTLHRWCKLYGKTVKPNPDWTYEWAARRRKKREFWKLRGYG